jgi:hypothetical protein
MTAKTIKPLYAASAVGITFTSLAGLGSSATPGTGAESAIADNTSELYARIRLHGRFCIGNGTLGGAGVIYVFLYPIIPDGLARGTPVGQNRIPQGIDQTLPRTAPNPTALFPETMPGVRLVATVPVTGPGTLSEWTALVANVPLKFGLFVRNYCGIPLSGNPAVWQASHAYALGAVVTPTVANNHYYLCVAAGTSGGSEPAWPTAAIGYSVVDSGATWLDMGPVAALGTGAHAVFYEGENDQIV